MEDEGDRRIRTSHGEVSLEQMAALLPGAGDIMAVVSRLYGNLWHAALGGNWDLADFYLRRTRALLVNLAQTRPKYAEQLRDYLRDHLEPVSRALLAREESAFREAFEASVRRANELHAVTGYPYVRWATPAAPPDPALDLGPPAPTS